MGYSGLTVFSGVYGPALAEMMRKDDFRLLDCLSLSTLSPNLSDSFSKVVDAAFSPTRWAPLMYADLAKLVKKQLAGAAWLSESDENTCMVDIVADSGIPLKSKENPLGLCTAQQLYEALTDSWTFAYLNLYPVLGFKLREKAVKASKVLMTVIETRLLQTAGTPGAIMSDRARKSCSRALHASDRPIGEVAGILTIAAICLVTAVSDAALTVDFYLKKSKENKKMLDETCLLLATSMITLRLSSQPCRCAAQRYVNEALRLRHPVAGSARCAVKSVNPSNVGGVLLTQYLSRWA
ncbi:hypothetical protein JCM10908_005441 [Rhodotorula pacifica]|uniref:uncharacterized protein n=1 Tax=Rhodotorula pacifica TaxID=1495444 RepID=UPI0031825601